MRSPRVLVLGHLPPSVGGPATYLSAVLSSSLADRFDLRPYNIGRPPKPKVHNNFGYSALWNAGLRRMLLAVAITLRHVLCFPLELLRLRPAIVHIHTAPYWVFWETAAYTVMSRALGIPCILQLHYSFRLFYSSCSAFPRRSILWVLRHVTVFVVICGEDLEFIEAIAPGRVTAVYLPNAIDVEGIRAAVDEVRRHRGPAAVVEVLFFGGSDTDRKGLPELLHAIPDVARCCPQARFRLVAVPPGRVRDLLSGAAIERCSIEGWVTGHRKVERLAQADVFALPTHGEGMPIAILEAMAAGLAIVATNVAGIPDLIRHEQDGLLISPGDTSALASALKRLIGSPGLRRTLASRARERVFRDFDLAGCVERWDALYRMVLRDTPHGNPERAGAHRPGRREPV